MNPFGANGFPMPTIKDFDAITKFVAKHRQVVDPTKLDVRELPSLQQHFNNIKSHLAERKQNITRLEQEIAGLNKALKPLQAKLAEVRSQSLHPAADKNLALLVRKVEDLELELAQWNEQLTRNQGSAADWSRQLSEFPIEKLNALRQLDNNF